MKLLLDTHTLLWWLQNDNKLSKNARELVGMAENQVFVSLASLWEITLKVSLGRLDFPVHAMANQLEVNAFEPLTIDLPHLVELSQLPMLHNDPFDRMLIAQARAENLLLITKDGEISRYPVKCRW